MKKMSVLLLIIFCSIINSNAQEKFTVGAKQIKNNIINQLEGPIVGVGYTGDIGIRKRRHPDRCFFMLWVCKRKKASIHTFVYDDNGVDFGDDWGSDEARANVKEGEGDFSFVFIEENILRMTVMSELREDFQKETSIIIDDETIFDDEVVELLGYKNITFENKEYEIKTDKNGRKYVDLIINIKE